MNAMDFRLSNNLGAFEFEYLELGSYFVKVEKAGLASTEIEVNLTAQAPSSNGVNFSLETGQIISIPESDESIDFEIFPNPVTSALNISFEKLSENYKLKLLDVMGNEIQINKVLKKSDSEVEINMHHLSPGVYFIEITNPDISYIHKFIKISE